MPREPVQVLLAKAFGDERLALPDLLNVQARWVCPSLGESVTQTPFATQIRYNYLSPEDRSERAIDRQGFMRLVRMALEWAEAIMVTRGRNSRSDSAFRGW